MAASLRSVLYSLRQTRITSLLYPQNININIVRGHKLWMPKYLKELYKRRIEAGPEPERHRSVWDNWNYESEIYAFGKRLGENFKAESLRTAFTQRSYIDAENEKRATLGLESEETYLDLIDNSKLQKKGARLTSTYVKAYLKHCLPRVPAEGIQSIHDNLTSDKTLAFCAKNLGFTDLILCAEFPPTEETFSSTFKAVIGALQQDQGSARACKLVEDIVLTQLSGQCVEDLWEIANPVGLLTDVLATHNREAPEPRLIWKAGAETVISTYLVGMYSNKELIGKAPGETVSIAEEMAARAALRNLFAMGPEKQPFNFTKSDNPTVDLENTNMLT